MNIYSARTEAPVTLAAGSATTVLGIAAPAQSLVEVLNFRIGFAGTVVIPVVVEFCACSFATNAPGTNSTLSTVQQVSGHTVATDATAAYAWTVEPTVITPLDELLLAPPRTMVSLEPYERDWAMSQGFALRCTAPGPTLVRATLRFGHS